MPAHELKISPDPDFGRLDMVLRRQGIPDRVPFYELYSNVEPEVLEAIGKAPELMPEGLSDEAQWAYGVRRHITYMYHLGYDYVNVGARNFAFPKEPDSTAMTAQGERAYVMAANHTIANREEFESYPWPDMSEVDYSPLERVAELYPPGMRGIAGSAGILENVMWLLGYEGISYLLADD